jgi:hypothetical protein
MREHVPQLVEVAYCSPEITSFSADTVAVTCLLVAARLLPPASAAIVAAGLPPELLTESTSRCTSLLIRRLASEPDS